MPSSALFTVASFPLHYNNHNMWNNISLVKYLKILSSGFSSTVCKIECSFNLIYHVLVSQIISFSFNQHFNQPLHLSINTCVLVFNISSYDISTRLGSSNWVNKTRIHPLKWLATLTPKLPESLYFWNGSTPSISGSGYLDLYQSISCTIKRCPLNVNKLLRNQISLCQQVFLL